MSTVKDEDTLAVLTERDNTCVKITFAGQHLPIFPPKFNFSPPAISV